MSNDKKSLLGSGIDRFFKTEDSNSLNKEENNKTTNESSLENGDKFMELDIDLIVANEYQPRTVFEDEALLELSKSIQENGILQPLTAIINKNGNYELIAGERRLRASKLAGLEKVPVIIKANIQDEKRSILAIIENLQREDLNCIELAISYKKAMNDFKLSQEQLALKLGIPRPNLTNTIRLLSLPEKVIKLLEKGKLSLGHGKILVGIKDANACIELAEKVISGDLTVAKLTSLVKKTENTIDVNAKELTLQKNEPSNKFLSVQNDLIDNTKLSLEIKERKDNGGQIIINFNTEEELNNIINLIKK